MDFKKLTDRAKELVDSRGGTEGLKKDAAELMEIAKSKGSVGDKAKSAFERLKTPAHKREGAQGDEGGAETQGRRKPDPGRPEGERKPASSSKRPASSNQQSEPEPPGEQAS
ncbi:MAG TPA: hypothetical protein VIL04_01090 [Solirubrobacterales bacterium]